MASSKLRHEFLSFCQHTTAHGFGYLSRSTSALAAALWLAAVAGATLLAAYFLHGNVVEYLAARTVTIIDSTTAPLSELYFPSVTVCNMNQVTRSFLGTLGMSLDANASLETKREQAMMTEVLFDSYIRGTQPNGSSRVDPTARAGYERTLRTRLSGLGWNGNTSVQLMTSPRGNDTVVLVTWKSSSTKYFFNAYNALTDYGACQGLFPTLDFREDNTSSSAKPRPYTGDDFLQVVKGVVQSGVQSGLRILLDAEVFDYAYFGRSAKGFRVALIDQRDTAVVNQNGFYVSPGTASLVSLTAQKISVMEAAFNRFSPEVRECYADGELPFQILQKKWGYRYSMTNCLYESVVQRVLRDCECTPTLLSFDVGAGLPMCIGGDQLECQTKIIDSYGNEGLNLTMVLDETGALRRCYPRCSHQQDFTSVSSSAYPSENTFFERPDLCLTMTKLRTVCESPVRRISLETFYGSAGFVAPTTLCSAILNASRLSCRGNLANPEFVFEPALRAFLLRYARDNLALVSVFYGNSYYTRMERQEQVSLVSFVGTAGGLMGLCLGMSFVSVVEIIFHIGCFFKSLCLQQKG